MEFKINYTKDGSEITETYIYDFNKMSVARIFYAEQLFILDLEFYRKENIPGTDEQFMKAIKRSAYKKALRTLLMKKLENGFEPFNDEVEPDISLFENIKGEDYYRLVDVKNDFFFKSEILRKNSMTESLNILNELKDSVTNEQFQLLMETAKVLTIEEQRGKNSEPNITAKNIGIKKSKSQKAGI